MKRFFVFTMVVLASQLAVAQSGFTFGVKGGLNFNKIITDAGSFGSNFNSSYDTRTGFSAGVFARIGNGFYVQPEVMYVERNGSLEGVNGTVYKIKYKSVDVPVLLGVKLLNVLRINAGPVANIKLSEKSDFLGTLGTATDKDAFKNASFGYQAGAGVSLGKFDIDLRKDGSLGSISDKYFQDQKFNQRLDGWQLTVGMAF